MERDPRDPDEAIIGGHDLKRMIFESGDHRAGHHGCLWYGYAALRHRPGGRHPGLQYPDAERIGPCGQRALRLSPRIRRAKAAAQQALLAANLGMLALQAVVSLAPFGRRLLGTTPLGMADLGAIGAGVMGPLVVNEGTKPAAPK